MSVHWTPVAVGVPFAKAEEMQKRLDGAGIAFLPAEATSWIGKLRAFIENAPDMSLFVDKQDVDRAKGLIKGIVDPAVPEQTVESYVGALETEQLKRLLGATGWPDLIIEPAKQELRERTMPPAPKPKASILMPLLMGGITLLFGPIGSWVSRQVIPEATPWDDKMIPVYDEDSQNKARLLVKIGLAVFLVWFGFFFVTKCFR